MSVGLDGVWAHSAWRAAERQVLAGLAEGHHVLLAGPAGSGKSLMLRAVAHALSGAGIATALLTHPWCGEGALERDVVIVDEFERLAPARLRGLFGRDRPVVFAGLPEAATRLEETAGLIGTVTLGLVGQEVVTGFVRARLARVARPAETFSAAALAALTTLSAGVFRAVVLLAGASLFFADSRGAAAVAESDVVEAAAMRARLTERDDAATDEALRVELALALS